MSALLGTTLVHAAQAPSPNARASQATPASRAARTTLALRGVTVVDVTDGRLLPEQTVVITGNRISQMGPRRTVRVPAGARIIKAQGKYLIPGLWDMHFHLAHNMWRQPPTPAELAAAARMEHTLLLSNGVTGIRDPGTPVPLDSMLAWRRAILAGRRAGPPRQLLGGPHLKQGPVIESGGQLRVDSMAAVRHAIDSLLAAGAEHFKLYMFSEAMQDSVEAEMRRRGVLFGGHDMRPENGARFADHMEPARTWAGCLGDSASLERCQQGADRLRRNDQWIVACGGDEGNLLSTSYYAYRPLSASQLERLKVPPRGAPLFRSENAAPQARQSWDLILRAQLPLVCGTDGHRLISGFAVHDGLASLVWEGFTPLQALQLATLNPAKALHATDSLGTVAPGKLADLVLLDFNPLALILNTTTIRAVIANGHYYDRAALDRLLAGVDYEFLFRHRANAGASD